MKKHISILFLLMITWACTKEIEPAASLNGATMVVSSTNGFTAPTIIKFKAPTNNGTSYKWWPFGSVNPSTSTGGDATFEQRYTIPATWDIIVVATGKGGSVGYKERITIEKPIPGLSSASFPVPTISNNNTIPCSVTLTYPSLSDANGEEVKFTITDPNGASFSDAKNSLSVWVPASTANAQKNIVIDFATNSLPGDYKVICEVRNSVGKSTNANQAFTLNKPVISSDSYSKIFTGGETGDDTAFQMVSDDAGNIYVAGTGSGVFKFGNFDLKNTFFVAKIIASTGNIDWVRNDATNLSTSVATGIVLDYLGNVCVSYNDISTGNNRRTGYVKYKQANGQDAGGVELVDQTVQFNYKNQVNGIATDKSSNIWLIFTAINASNSNDRHFKVFKFPANGAVKNSPINFFSSEFSPGTTTKNDYSEGYDITAYDNDNIYITGAYKGKISLATGPGNSPNLISNIFKLNANAQIVWGLANEHLSLPDHIAQPNLLSNLTTDNIGNVYLAGSYKGSATQWSSKKIFNRNTNIDKQDSYILKCTTNGNLEWIIPTIDNVAIYGIGKNKNNEILIAGSTLDDRVIFQKYNSTGANILNKKPTTNGSLSAASGIAEDNNGNIFFSGRYNGAVTTIGGVTLPTAKGDDILILKYNK
jgi:hypothetical protein